MIGFIVAGGLLTPVVMAFSLAMAGYGALKLSEMPSMFWVILAGKPYRRQARLICQHREAANPSIYTALKQAREDKGLFTDSFRDWQAETLRVDHEVGAFETLYRIRQERLAANDAYDQMRAELGAVKTNRED